MLTSGFVTRRSVTNMGNVNRNGYGESSLRSSHVDISPSWKLTQPADLRWLLAWRKTPSVLSFVICAVFASVL